MNHPDLFPSQAPGSPAGPLDLDDLEGRAFKSKAVAWREKSGQPNGDPPPAA
jgi:hypothetical protein